MGGSVKQFAKSTFEDTMNISTGGMYGAVSQKGNFLENMGKNFTQSLTDSVTGKEMIKGATNILNDVTGVTAMQQKLDQEAEMSRQEARRRALLSDAMARAEGADNAKITLNTARRAKRAGGSGTGVAGMDTAQGTGVQS